MNRCRLAVALLLSVPAMAQEPSLQLESRVTGNQELPRVMYILPWRKPAEVEFSWQPEPGVAAALFQPLRRDEYRRELKYRATVTDQGSAVAPETDIEQ